MKPASRLSTLLVAVIALAAAMPGFAQETSSAPLSLPASGSATVPVGQKFIMQLETAMHSRTTRKGDRIEFTTAGDVVIDSLVVIPAKSLVRGTVTRAKRAGLLFGRAEIRLRFDDVKLADGAVLALKASITRVGFDPVDPKTGKEPKIQGEPGASSADAKAIASAGAQGAMIGIMTGSLQGAAYGAATGAAVAAAMAALKRGPDLDLPRTTMFEARFDGPLNIPEKSLLAAQRPPAFPSGQGGRPAEDPTDDAEPVNTQVAETPPPPPVSADSSDEEKITATRPVLKRRTPSAEETESREPESTPAPVPPDAPAPPPKPSAEPPARASVESRPPESSIPTISVRVRMVQVDAVVRDRGGRMLENLRADDFRVYEDSILQQVQSFSRDELPIAVALVVDRSGSVAPFISELRRIATRTLNQLKPEDQVCLFSFAADVDRVEDLTADRNRIADAINRIHAGGGTDITDALYESVKYLARNAPGRRHAVILISDNQQTVTPHASDAETIKAAMESETVVYSLKTAGSPFQIAAQLPSILFGGGTVAKVAQETGGEVINVGSVSSLDSALGSVISRLRLRYALGYYPAGTAQGGVFHEIKVRLDDRFGKPGSDYFVHARRGYYATGGSSGPAPATKLQVSNAR